MIFKPIAKIMPKTILPLHLTIHYKTIVIALDTISTAWLNHRGGCSELFVCVCVCVGGGGGGGRIPSPFAPTEVRRRPAVSDRKMSFDFWQGGQERP